MTTSATSEAMPLRDVRVVDISNFLAAPMISMFLGDFGAEVVKVEKPAGGDELRTWGNERDGVGLYYKVLNRNKKSVVADLRTPLGVEIVKRLIERSDVVIENFRPGRLEQWGLSYEVMRAINPGIVLVRITGFGQTGPYSRRPGFGTLAEGFAGYAHITGYPDRPPLLPAFGLADSTSGLAGAFLTMVALSARDRSGLGQVIDLAIYEPLFTLLGPQLVDYDQLGKIQGRSGSRLPFTSPRNTYRTRDGQWVAVAGSAQSIFERLCHAVDRPELIDDTRFSDNRARILNAEMLDDALQEAIGSFELDDLMIRLDRYEAAGAPVNTIAQIVEDPHIQDRRNIVLIPDDELGGPIRMQNVLGNLSRTPGAILHAGPRLGQHNREILVEELGFGEAELEAAGIGL